MLFIYGIQIFGIPNSIQYSIFGDFRKPNTNRYVYTLFKQVFVTLWSERYGHTDKKKEKRLSYRIPLKILSIVGTMHHSIKGKHFVPQGHFCP